MRPDSSGRVFDITLPAGRGARTVRITRNGSRGTATVLGPPVAAQTAERLAGIAAHVLRLDEDLSPFYALVSDDPDLAWVARGAGRMVRSATVFEDVVKTICTTNCAWSATERMVSAIVGLGPRAPGAPANGPDGRAFPKPETIANAGERFLREEARAGYRAVSLLRLARDVADGRLDLETLAAPESELPDDELERRLLGLPGVGPYAAAHVMTMLGRYSRLILDSWTRPTYARLTGRRRVPDRTIERRFKPYGRYAGLAFWLYLTRDWVDDAGEAAPPPVSRN
jgi:N-glycosylase/DNA lyase